LKKHGLVHSGSYECPICGKTVKKSDNKHEKRHYHLKMLKQNTENLVRENIQKAEKHLAKLEKGNEKRQTKLNEKYHGSSDQDALDYIETNYSHLFE